MTDKSFLSDEAAADLLGMPDDQLDQLLEARVLALHSDPSLSLESAFEPETGALESFDVPPWIGKTVQQMLNTAIHQTYSVACGTDADYKNAALGISGTTAVIALAGFLTTTVGLAAALASVIATILIKRILGPALATGHKTMCKELKAYLPD
jgi:hypothetical protein